jgi:hypothetical protein
MTVESTWPGVSHQGAVAAEAPKARGPSRFGELRRSDIHNSA